jgi:shikimate dehydrogenase
MTPLPPQSELNRVPTDAGPQRSYRVGLIGRGIQGSRSPAMHIGESLAQGLNLTYELLDLDQRRLGDEALPQLLTEAETRGFAGLNITYPCKQAVIPLLHELSEEAQAVGAVNTVQFREGRRIGYNTDASGFEESFRRGMPHAPLSSVVQIGAGGAGAATAFALLRLGTRRLTLVDVVLERAHALAAGLERRFRNCEVRAGSDLAQALAAADGVLNTTPLGMTQHPGSAVPAELLRPSLWVADIVYVPIETQLLRNARAAGCRTLDGGGMAVFQAARAFEIFTERAADSERMRRQFETLTGQ